MDQIRAINDIDCSKMREREFATVVLWRGWGGVDDYVGSEEASVYWFVQISK